MKFLCGMEIVQVSEIWLREMQIWDIYWTWLRLFPWPAHASAENIYEALCFSIATSVPFSSSKPS